MPHARKHEHFRRRNFRRLARDGDSSSELAEGPFYGRHVAGAVVDQRDVHNSSFVLGSTLRSRLSRDTAKRSARAKALKRAST